MTERLQKFLARAGVGSRRACEAYIVEGRVTVNGHVVRELGTRVDPEADAVKFDGRKIRSASPTTVVLALNKPRGVVTTMSDPEGRPTVADLLHGLARRVYPVGRLDFHSEGLLLVTDDGTLARDLTHPGKEVPKTYLAKVRGRPDDDALRRVARGILLDGRKTAPARVRVVRPGANVWVEITVTEGRNRLVRRLFEAVGHPVQRLRRIAFGPIELGRLPAGRVRALSADEVAALRSAGAGTRRPRERRARRRPDSA